MKRGFMAALEAGRLKGAKLACNDRLCDQPQELFADAVKTPAAATSTPIV